MNLRVTQGESHARIRYAKALRAGLIRSKPNRPEPFRIFSHTLLRLGLSGSGRASARYSEHRLGFGFSMLFTLGAG